MKRPLPFILIALALIGMALLQGCQTPGKPSAKPQPEAAVPEPDTDRFRTEHIRVGKLKVLGVEHLKPYERFSQAGWNVFYEFHILDENGKTTGRFISFGSYDSTNEISQAFGAWPKGFRTYHLDLYEVDRETGRMTIHALIRFYHSETKPKYDKIRDEAIEIFDKNESGDR